MAGSFVGKWVHESSDNFEAYLVAVGVSADLVKLAGTVTPTVTVSVSGDTWTLKSESSVKNSEIQFKLGQEFSETTADGRTMQTTITLDGGKLIQQQNGAIPSTIIREVIGGKLVVTCKAKDVVSVRNYVKG